MIKYVRRHSVPVIAQLKKVEVGRLSMTDDNIIYFTPSNINYEYKVSITEDTNNLFSWINNDPTMISSLQNNIGLLFNSIAKCYTKYSQYIEDYIEDD